MAEIVDFFVKGCFLLDIGHSAASILTNNHKAAVLIFKFVYLGLSEQISNINTAGYYLCSF